MTSFINSLEVHYGLGRHINYLSPYQIMMAAKIDDLSQPFSTFSSCFARISVALLLRRIINPSKPQRYLLWFVIISLLIITFVQNVIQFVRCKPVGKLWNPEIPGTCWNGDVSSKMGYVQAGNSTIVLHSPSTLADHNMKRGRFGQISHLRFCLLSSLVSCK